MSLTPDIKLNWNQVESKFKGEVIDPATGIRTYWEQELHEYKENGVVDAFMGKTKRSDEFLDGVPKRVIIETRYPGNFRLRYITAYSIYYAENDVSKSITFRRFQEVDDESIQFEMGIRTSDPMYSGADYSPNGELKCIRLNLSASRSDMPDFSSMPFQDKLMEMGQIFKYRGEIALVAPKSMDEEGENLREALEVSKDILKEEINEKIKKWPKEIRDEAIDRVTEIIGTLIEQQFGEDFSEEEKEEMLVILSMRVLRMMPVNFDLLSRHDKKLSMGQVISEAVVDILEDYYREMNIKGNFMAEFIFNPDDKDKLQLSIDDLKEEFQLGKQYVYDKYSFTITRINGRVNLNVEDIMRPQSNRNFEFPEIVDLNGVYNFVSTVNSSGWERAIDLVKNKLLP